MLGGIADIAVAVISFGIAHYHWKVWWLVIALLFAASLSVTNGPSYQKVIIANRQGRLGVFPHLIFWHAVSRLPMIGIIYGIGKLLS